MEKVEVTPVIGLPQLAGWSHVVTNHARTITFSLAISGQHASNVGRDLVDELENIHSDSVAVLYAAITKLQRDVAEKNCVMHLAAAMVLDGKGIFLATKGMIVLHRQGKLGKILQASDTLQVIEGTWHADDLFILLTEPAVALYNEIEQKISQGYEDDIVITSLVPSVHSLENSSLYALAFVRKVEVQVPAAEERVVDSEEAISDVESSFSLDVNLEVGEPTAPELPAEPAPSAPLSSESSTARPPQPPLPTQSPLPRQLPLLGFFKNTLLPGFRSVPSRLSMLLRASKPFSKEVYVTSGSQRILMRKLLLLGIPLLILVSGASYYLYQRQTARAQVSQQLAAFVAQAQTIKAEAATDPVGAREKMQQKIAEITQFKTNVPQQHGIPGLVDESIAQVQQAYDDISGLEAIDALDQFFDLRLVSSDFIATKIVSAEEKLLFIDEGKKQLISLSLPNKQHTTLDLSGRESVRDVVADGSDILVLGDGVYRYSSSAAEPTQIIANDEQVQTASLLAFFNDTYYIVSPEKQNIFRYRPNEEDEYEIAVGWVKAGQAIDFNQALSFHIDGDIWVSTKEGQLLRYNSGEQQDFTPTGVSTPFEHAVWLVTDENKENIYVLEPDNKRLVVLTKDGTFLKEIQSSSLLTATGLAVNEDETKAYVISGSLVYELPL
ncbi:MAG TPA: hypothetical protein VF209_05085 [Patescibacteria group bacterium]